MLSRMKVMIKKHIGIPVVILLAIAGLMWWSGAFQKLTGSTAVPTPGDQPMDVAKSVTADANKDVPSGPEPTYFAKVVDGKVTQVIVADAEFIKTFDDGTPGEWIQTSYNTSGGVHRDPNTGQPDGKEALRKNAAGIGYSYDKKLDAFVPPSPYKSWTLNKDTALWEPPVAMPTDGKKYTWNETKKDWEEMSAEAGAVLDTGMSKATDAPVGTDAGAATDATIKTEAPTVVTPKVIVPMQ